MNILARKPQSVACSTGLLIGDRRSLVGWRWLKHRLGLQGFVERRKPPVIVVALRVALRVELR